SSHLEPHASHSDCGVRNCESRVARDSSELIARLRGARVLLRDALLSGAFSLFRSADQARRFLRNGAGGGDAVFCHCAAGLREASAGLEPALDLRAAALAVLGDGPVDLPALGACNRPGVAAAAVLTSGRGKTVRARHSGGVERARSRAASGGELGWDLSRCE